MARPAGDIADRLVVAARKHFLVDGVEGASLRAIARDARTSLGMITYYFPTKDDLFAATVEQVYERLVDDIARVLRGAGSTDEGIHAVYARLSAMSADESSVVRLILREALSPSPRIEWLFARFSRGHIGLMAEFVVRGVGAGEVRGDLPAMAIVGAMACLGVLPQLIRQRLSESAPQLASVLPPGEDLARALAGLLSAGVRPAKRSAMTP